MIRTQVQLEKHQVEWLREKAGSGGVSISQLIRESIECYRRQEERLPRDRKQRALSAVGRYASGVAEISEKHDDYLAEAYRSGTDRDA